MINKLFHLLGLNSSESIILNPNIEIWDGKSVGTVITIRGQTGNYVYDKIETGYVKRPEFYNNKILLKANVTVGDLYKWYYTKKFIDPSSEPDKKIHKYFSFIIYPKQELSYRFLDDNDIVNKYKLIYFVFTGNRREYK